MPQMPRQGATPQRPPQQRPVSRGMGDGLDPLREGARESHTRHVQQARAMQTRLQLGNEDVRTPLRLTLP